MSKDQTEGCRDRSTAPITIPPSMSPAGREKGGSLFQVPRKDCKDLPKKDIDKTTPVRLEPIASTQRGPKGGPIHVHAAGTPSFWDPAFAHHQRVLSGHSFGTSFSSILLGPIQTDTPRNSIIFRLHARPFIPCSVSTWLPGGQGNKDQAGPVTGIGCGEQTLFCRHSPRLELGPVDRYPDSSSPHVPVYWPSVLENFCHSQCQPPPSKFPSVC